MHLLSLAIFSMAALGTRRSFSGAGPSGMRNGLTALNFSQNGVMSTTRSLIGAKLPMGSMRTISSPLSTLTCSTCVMQASTVLPLALQAHEPQMALRHEYRTATVPSCSF